LEKNPLLSIKVRTL